MQLMRTALALELGVGNSMGGCKCIHQAANGREEFEAQRGCVF